MKLNEKLRIAVNTLRYLERLNIGDDLEYHIRETLYKINKLPKSNHYFKCKKGLIK